MLYILTSKYMLWRRFILVQTLAPPLTVSTGSPPKVLWSKEGASVWTRFCSGNMNYNYFLNISICICKFWLWVQEFEWLVVNIQEVIQEGCWGAHPPGSALCPYFEDTQGSFCWGLSFLLAGAPTKQLPPEQNLGSWPLIYACTNASTS